jgi:hypothetical protein
MAGSVDFSIRSDRKVGGLKCLICSWTSDGSGDVSGNASPSIRGEIVKIVTDPDAAAVPSDNYNILLNDEHGLDVAQGLLGTRDEANAEVVYPGILFTDGSNTAIKHVGVCGALTPVISSAGASKKGTIYVYYKE